MTAQSDLDRRTRQVQVTAQEIETALARRPGALPPNEHRDVLRMTSTAMRGVSTVVFAGPVQQCETAQTFLELWRSLLPLAEQATWPDPDDEER